MIRANDRRASLPGSSFWLSRSLVLLLFLPGVTLGWGGFTHQKIAYRALVQLAEGDPGARRVLESPKLRDAFLGGSMGPDMALNFLTSEPDMTLHRLLHQPEFAEALVQASQQDPEELAAALGWMAHRIADDEGAHGPEGYANQKQTFVGPLKGQNHTVSEAMLDILALQEEGPHNQPLAFVPGRLAEAAQSLGGDYSVEHFEKLGKKFRREVRVTEMLFLAVARQDKPLLASARSFYADAQPGVSEGRGIDRALAAVIGGLGPHLQRFPQEVPADHWWEGLSLGQRAQNTAGWVGSAVARIKWTADLSQHALDGLDELGLVHKSAAVDFFRTVLVTRAEDYGTFVQSFEGSFEK